VLLLFNIVKSYFISVFQQRKKTIEKIATPAGEAAIDVQPSDIDPVNQQREDLPLEEIDEELSDLDLQNIAMEFIIDLRSLAGTALYISSGGREDHVISTDKTKGVVAPLHEEIGGNAAGSVRVSVLETKPPWELEATPSESTVKYAFTARLEFVRDMDPRVRLAVLRRLKHLSDISRARLGRSLETNDQGFEESVEETKSSTSSLGDSIPRKADLHIDEAAIVTDAL
jgi:hypothetical protein